MVSLSARRFLAGKPLVTALLKKLEKAKLDAAPGERPDRVRTFARTTIIVPEMVGSIIGVHNGKIFNRVKIKPECVGHYLGEFSLTRKRKPHATHIAKASKSSKGRK
ncbi:hypothetical protein L6164_010024 [Bauhinia variegata]|uniref:Uncharacterized protein n=1 Tax=Bauhinia variegata TaxID=167791 RepID=A0ACB9PKZ9_BAUVA|nr:hypothetical protein L6164_010024 [Bauhinia variegata]